MNFMQLMKQRESCRIYQDKCVSREDLLQIVEAGRLSPSGCNAQPWRFIIVDETESKQKVCDALAVETGKTGAPWRDQVPAFVVVVEEKANVAPAVFEYYQDTQCFAQGDLGMAVMNMCYEAVELGLSTCIIGMNSQKKMQEGLGVPADKPVRMVLAVGYSAEKNTMRPKVRKPMDEICSFNHW